MDISRAKPAGIAALAEAMTHVEGRWHASLHSEHPEEDGRFTGDVIAVRLRRGGRGWPVNLGELFTVVGP